MKTSRKTIPKTKSFPPLFKLKRPDPQNPGYQTENMIQDIILIPDKCAFTLEEFQMRSGMSTTLAANYLRHKGYYPWKTTDTDTIGKKTTIRLWRKVTEEDVRAIGVEHLWRMKIGPKLMTDDLLREVVEQFIKERKVLSDQP